MGLIWPKTTNLAYKSSFVSPNLSANIFIIDLFRLSNHGLMIEVGRHHNTPRDKRFCPFCPRRIENEIHFLYECPTFEHLRSRFLKPTTDTLPGFAFLHNDMKIHILLSSMVKNTSKYIAKGMELRSFLLSKPKSLN